MAVQRASREGRTLRWLVVVPIVGAVLDDVAYVVLIASQSEHPPDIFTVPFVAVFIALMAAMLALSLAGNPLVVRLRPALRAGAAAGLIVRPFSLRASWRPARPSGRSSEVGSRRWLLRSPLPCLQWPCWWSGSRSQHG